MDKQHFDRTDYSVVVKNRAPPPSSWKWEIYRAGEIKPGKAIIDLFSHHGDRRRRVAAVAHLATFRRKIDVFGTCGQWSGHGRTRPE